jgi:cell division protein FtsQ
MSRKLKIAIWIVVIIGIIIALKYADHRFRKQKLKEIIIEIDINGSEPMIEEEEIRSLIQQGHDSVQDQEVGEVDLQLLENLIQTNPYVLSVNAFINMDATLEINVKQRKPLLRIFNTRGESYYVDCDGALLPLHPETSVYVPIANGDIRGAFLPSLEYRRFDTITEEQCRVISVEEKLFHMAEIIVEDSLLSELVAQIFVVNASHFELVPRIGNHKIIFGDAYDSEEKLMKLKYFYSEAYRKFDLGIYKAFDLRFRNQVVCIKK